MAAAGRRSRAAAAGPASPLSTWRTSLSLFLLWVLLDGAQPAWGQEGNGEDGEAERGRGRLGVPLQSRLCRAGRICSASRCSGCPECALAFCLPLLFRAARRLAPQLPSRESSAVLWFRKAAPQTFTRLLLGVNFIPLPQDRKRQADLYIFQSPSPLFRLCYRKWLCQLHCSLSYVQVKHLSCSFRAEWGK